MELKKLFTEDRAVSPVVAVVLMVAVTVILAAIVASFALGMGSSAEAKPQASFEYDLSGSSVEITHVGGDPLQASRVTVLVNGTDDGNSWSATKIDTGDTYTTAATGTNGEVRIVWEGDSGQTATLSTYEVP